MASNEQQQSYTLPLSQLLANRRNKKKNNETTSTLVVDLNSNSNLTWSEKFGSLEPTVIPPIAKKPEIKQIQEMLKPAVTDGYIYPIGAFPRDVMDRRKATSKKKAEVQMTTNVMFFPHFSKDGATFTNFIRAGDKGRDFKERDIREFYSAMVISNLKIGSSGTMEGLLNRLVTGMTEVPSPRRFDVGTMVGYAKLVLDYEPITIDYRGKSLDDMLTIPECEPRLNGKSDAGVPYFAKIEDDDVVEQAIVVAAGMLVDIAEGKFAKWTRVHGTRLAVLLKNKRDYYVKEKLHEKVRPYFVYPLHERILYQVMQNLLKPVLFYRAGTIGGSAVGFSWNNGGADILYDFIAKKDKHGFYPIFYGDDQLWVVVVRGEKFIYTPDFSHMDLSLAPEWGTVAFKIWKDRYEKIDKTWRAVLKLNCERCFSKQVIVDSALTYQFSKGVASGIPGTTKFDEVASAAVNGFIKSNFETQDVNTPEDLVPFMQFVSKAVEEIFGLRFKEGSLTPYEFKADQDEYEFVFLGQTLTRIMGGDGVNKHYVPKPQLDSLVLAATSHKKAYDTPKFRQRAQQSKLRSLYAGGGYLYPVFAELVREQYERDLANDIRPLTGEDQELLESSVFIQMDFTNDALPDDNWCRNLYLPENNKYDENFNSVDDVTRIREPVYGFISDTDDEGITEAESSESDGPSLSGSPPRPDLAPPRIPLPPRPVGWKKPEIEVLPHLGSSNPSADRMRMTLDKAKGDWSSADSVTRPLFDKDVGSAVVAKPARVPSRGQATPQPLATAEKERYNALQAEKRALEKAMRQLTRGAQPPARKGKEKAHEYAARQHVRSGAAAVLNMDQPDSDDDTE